MKHFLTSICLSRNASCPQAYYETLERSSVYYYICRLIDLSSTTCSVDPTLYLHLINSVNHLALRAFIAMFSHELLIRQFHVLAIYSHQGKWSPRGIIEMVRPLIKWWVVVIRWGRAGYGDCRLLLAMRSSTEVGTLWLGLGRNTGNTEHSIEKLC